ncbi:hypothetical protein V8C40DRAFT_248013 [Trichoderma camerunense]
MNPYERVDISPETVIKVSHIAIELGKTKRQPLYGQLGAQLFIAAQHLVSIWPHQEKSDRKLFQDVEKICSYPEGSEDGLPRLRALAQAVPNTVEYKSAEENIQKSIMKIPEDRGREALSHFQNYIKSIGVRKLTTSEPYTLPKSIPDEHPGEMKALVYNQKSIFASRQDVQLVAPRFQDSTKLVVKWKDSGSEGSQACEKFEEIDLGNLREFIRQEIEARLRLRIHNGQLPRSLHPKPPIQTIERDQGMSLATVLREYHVTAKMKVTLAYILAQSAWISYDSDWMDIHWTSETIHFMRQYSRIQGKGESEIYLTNPHFSARFTGENKDHREATSAIGEIHRYPRVRALGIMLVEIGLGPLLSQPDNEHANLTQAAKANQAWAAAKRHSDSQDSWPEFDYGNYRRAVQNCLHPGIFRDAPFDPDASNIELARGLVRRRKIFHDQVVSPLEQLVHGTRWYEDRQKIGPLRSYTAVQEKAISREADTFVLTQIRETISRSISSVEWKSSREGSRKSSRKWLERIDRLNKRLSSLPGTTPRERIRIAILDTGYDADSAYFQHNSRRNRLVKWRDWVEHSTTPQDCNGHGTHLVALVMRIVPEAEICVARVANDHQGLEKAIISISEAIKWAQSECKADIISMSFGHIRDHKPISRAIYNAIKDKAILFFAAAANFGANERELFPARHECVISIRGTNSNGQFQDFNPPRNSREGKVFGTLGLEVPSVALTNASEAAFMTGTSVATAIAAGIAGMLLEYVGGKSDTSAYHIVKDFLHTREGMLDMFEEMGTTPHDDGRIYVAPWSLFRYDDESRWAMFQAVAAKHS